MNFRIGLDRNVIFGGDLNLRDKELVEVGGLPASTRYTTLCKRSAYATYSDPISIESREE